MKQEIKGSCENCGLCYKGEVRLVGMSFPEVTCPNCSKETNNFSEAYVVDETDKIEGVKIDYKEVIFA